MLMKSTRMAAWTLLAWILPALPALVPPSLAAPHATDPLTVHIFHEDRVHFAPDDPGSGDRPVVNASDNGRMISRTVQITPPAGTRRILAKVILLPIAKDVQSVHDKWDRAGTVQLVLPEGPPIEVLKFITAYGGRTEHELDVSHLAPLLRGECMFRGFVDTWVSPAWKMSFSLTFEPLAEEPRPEWMPEWVEDEPGAPDWVRSVLFEPSVTRARMEEGPFSVPVDVPAGTARVALYYLASGHCTDGSGADEFVPKDHVILVDGAEVHRFRPWRDDCRNFRDVNPYCRRWFDGSWSADFSRSGWCPGDAVEPVRVELPAMEAGAHTVDFRVADIRPEDESGYGYWRVSAYLAGWNE
jgi:hypothetical protein